ncbi:hypothetical protein CA13_42440 [Planctomycetes bacterium CA13]|uniref:Uncharacterized protein n=1 Tax=Novipirellula herctigrandis TaxID=2527986 RepID=A0A5C5Z7I7_9BACT|nr:hypothetical protein CA13_42440 [Planctomycetes bacterium CA13]
MHRMIPYKSTCLTLFATAVLAIYAGLPQTHAQPPRVVHADADYAASGYVTPAGMVPPEMYQGPVMPVGYNGLAGGGCATGNCGGPAPMAYGNMGGYSEMPYGDVGYGCDSCDGGCDGMGCGGQCGCLSCCVLGEGGLLGKLGSPPQGCGGCGQEGCQSCGGLTNLRHMCLFCQGSGCSACQFLGRGYLLGALSSLKPYQDAGKCALRWCDLSAEALFMGQSRGGASRALTSLGIGGPIVLSSDDADAEDLEAGMRLSAAMIFGAGGDIEFTYMGGQEWGGSASVSNASPVLYSYISKFGTDPNDGFDDTDRSIRQSVDVESDFDSFEFNYRRRTMGPYCRFQASWLVGLRHLLYTDGLTYSALGEMDNTVNASLPRYFSSSDRNKNRLFGPQAGFDLWYNMMPGVNLGFGGKFAWMQNDIKRSTVLSANSLDPLATPGTVELNDTERDITVMGELEATILYRLSHSWTFRSSYYMIAVDDISFGGLDDGAINNFISAQTVQQPGYSYDSLVLNGFSFGAEYIW